MQDDAVRALSLKVDLRNDSVAYVCARIRKWYRQRIEFPVPRDVRQIISKRHLPGTGWVINGIFCGVFKTGPNPKNPFFCGGSINGEKFIDWKICLRDVLVKSAHGEEYMLFSRRRSRNKKHVIEFSIRDIMLSVAENDRLDASAKSDIAIVERLVQARDVSGDDTLLDDD